jgi:hypothetical protein
MNTTSLNTIGPTVQAMPPALLVSSQLPLTEKVSATVKADYSPDLKQENLAIHTSRRIEIFGDYEDYSHCGIND